MWDKLHDRKLVVGIKAELGRQVLEDNQSLKSIGYADTGWRFISSGIVFDKSKVQTIKNRNLYDQILTPSKPSQGGFWGSFYTPDKEYRSEWERFVNEKMNLTSWMDKIRQPSTVFSLKSKTTVLCLNTFDDLYGGIDYEAGRAKIVNPAFPTHFVKVRNEAFKNYEQQPFIDFEKIQNIDAIIVSKNFVELVRWCLLTFEARANKAIELGIEISDDALYDEQLTPYEVIFAEMFEDWHVESIFVMNPNCVEVIEVLE